MSTNRRTRIARMTGGVLGAAALAVGIPSIAGAHVGVDPEQAAAGSYELLTFSVPHGCETSPTTKVEIEIPEQVLSVTPTVNPNWEVEAMTAKGPAPVKGEAITKVIYTAKTPLPSHLRDAFELSVAIPEEPGQTMAFPIVQTCKEGKTEWAELPEEGQNPHDLEKPAPLVEVLEPAEDEHGEAMARETSNEDAAGAAGDNAADNGGDNGGDDDSNVSAMNVAGFGTGIAGLVLGGAALLYAYRRNRSIAASSTE